MKISGSHPNRRLYNWLIYDLIDHFLIKSVPLYRGKLYDFGCGEAPYRDFFNQHVSEYIGVDWSSSYYDNTSVDISADLNGPLPIESETADLVVSLSVLEHIREPQTMLKEAFRILKPGGSLLLQVPWQWWIHEPPHDYFRYTPFGLHYLLKKAGFTDVIVESQAGYFTTSVLKFNYLTRRLVRGPGVARWLMTGCLVPFWYLGQKLAPILDSLDSQWELEAVGYCVTATKADFDEGHN